MNDLTHKLAAGALSGLVAALATDVAAFRSWRKWDDAKSYNWGIASFRWFQGALLGALAAFGLASL